MQVTARQILDALDDPERLEALYRQDPESFRESLHEASRAAQDSVTLRVWRARLDYRDAAGEHRDTAGRESRRRLWYTVSIGIAVGALVRLPAVQLGAEWYYPRFAPSLVLLSLAAYFWLKQRDRRQLIVGLVLTAVVALYLRVLPGDSDSVVMAWIHLPVLFWAFAGIVFSGRQWRDVEPRVSYIRYNGELLVLASLVALGGIVFSGITVALFELVSSNPSRWYAENVGVVGAAAVPVAGTYLYDVTFNGRTGIASVLARVFAPLFLVMTPVYLVFSFAAGQNPFVDRSFLIIFNGLLLVVLGMTVFSIAERRDDTGAGWTDYVKVALLAVTIVVDAIALSAMVFRLASYGLTPNRVVVLGANLVIMVHLAWLCRAYVGMARRSWGMAEVRRAVAGYLPVYVIWAALVAFLLPIVFRFS